MSNAPQEYPVAFNEQLWFRMFGEGHPLLIEKQAQFRKIGKGPRCKLCLAPFGKKKDEVYNIDIPGPSSRNPRFCSLCDKFIRDNPGGAKVRMAMVFADVRASTKLSEEVELYEYVRLINEFYAATTAIFVETDGFMIDVLGDEVFSLYPTGFSGVNGEIQTIGEREVTAAKKAFEAVTRLAQVSQKSPPDGLSFGISLHVSEVYVGTIRGAEEGVSDVRVWGPGVNKAARMCGASGAGEVLMTPSTAMIVGLESSGGLERRELALKGFSDTSTVLAIRAS